MIVIIVGVPDFAVARAASPTASASSVPPPLRRPATLERAAVAGRDLEAGSALSCWALFTVLAA